ncbi:hypothetical protein GLOIN_2v1780145 [Rhizophagus irregularis DAOM 181602=DAOM 197198]|nr:hypothetical protein RhiirB3_432374 [Rhizophagus irregularis]GET56359.1 hypothetical protein GLOIN_2v1780145 [Rhizophagus irregularis DAOM 181602=DAOM 197198]
MAAKAADHKYKCKNDIVYDMNLIDQWYNELLQALERYRANLIFSFFIILHLTKVTCRNLEV